MHQRLLEKKHIRIPNVNGARQSLPESLDNAAGLLKKKYRDLLKHYAKIRKEWSTYASK